MEPLRGASPAPGDRAVARHRKLTHHRRPGLTQPRLARSVHHDLWIPRIGPPSVVPSGSGLHADLASARVILACRPTPGDIWGATRCKGQVGVEPPRTPFLALLRACRACGSGRWRNRSAYSGGRSGAGGGALAHRAVISPQGATTPVSRLCDRYTRFHGTYVWRCQMAREKRRDLCVPRAVT